MKFRAVLFDAAETLFTTRGSVGEIYAGVARNYGSTAPADAIHAAFLKHFRGGGPSSPAAQKTWWKDIVHRVFTEVGMVNDFDRYFEDVYDQFRDSTGWRLFPETREVLQNLSQHSIRLGVISNFDDRVYSVLDSLGIRSFFDAVTISSETGYSKPDREIFEAAAAALHLPPADILVVGDSLHDDVEGGLRAGFSAVLLDRNGRYASLKTVRRIASLTEVVSLQETCP